MKTQKTLKIIKHFDPLLYKDELLPNIGQSIEVKTITNGKIIKTVVGVLSYVANSCFGVKIEIKGDSYTSSFSFADIFTDKIVYSLV